MGMQQKVQQKIPWHQSPRSRLVCFAEAGKGFGTVKPPKPSPKKKQKVAFTNNGDDAVKRAVQYADAKSKRSNPVDPKQASKGSIDYAKVKDWGPEKAKDPGALQMQSFIPGSAEELQKQAFYNRLAFRLLRENEAGTLDDILYNQLPVPFRRDLPPPDRWTYTIPSYVQYLVDLQAVHKELESGVAEVLATLPEGSSNKAAVDFFSQARGLDRSLEIATDLTNLDHTMDNPDHPGPSLHIAAYTKYLRELAVQPSDQGSVEHGLKLIAHVYANQLHHFTNGAKLGASIAQKLNLFKLNAVHLFRTYQQFDQFPGRDPFKAFQANVNTCGSCLSEEQRQIVEDEIPWATAHSMVMVWPLAQAS